MVNLRKAIVNLLMKRSSHASAWRQKFPTVVANFAQLVGICHPS
ncbi:hypothetical protein [Allocoleopsis sp.]